MTAAWEAWLDRLATGEKPTVEVFARSAIETPPRCETRIRYPTAKSMWPPEVWADMEAIRKGEKP